MHLALATPTDDPAFKAEPTTAEDLARDAWRVDTQINMTLDALKRGMSQTDDAFAEFKNRHDQAYDEIKEAANSDTGLFDLSRTVDGAQSSAIEYGGSHCYSEQSPYAGLDRQARIGRGEDRGGNGGTST